MEVSNRK